MTSSEEQPRRGRGRPRSPGAEEKILHSALEEYTEHGWAGFTMDGVARRAGFGKSTLYLRWPDKDALLTDAVRLRTRVILEEDTGSLEGDLTALATAAFREFADPEGWARFRMVIDTASASQSLGQFTRELSGVHREVIEGIFQRARDRGELHVEVEPAVRHRPDLRRRAVLRPRPPSRPPADRGGGAGRPGGRRRQGHARRPRDSIHPRRRSSHSGHIRRQVSDVSITPMNPGDEPRRGRGRPRTPGAEEKILSAALDEYGERGWAGFTMDGVARRAGVGKSTVYLRWHDKDALLTDAVTNRGMELTAVDTGTFEGDLLAAGPQHAAPLPQRRRLGRPAGHLRLRERVGAAGRLLRGGEPGARPPGRADLPPGHRARRDGRGLPARCRHRGDLRRRDGQLAVRAARGARRRRRRLIETRAGFVVAMVLGGIATEQARRTSPNGVPHS